MRKITWIPLLIIIIGVCLALAGFAAGGMHNGFWIDRAGVHISSAERGELVIVDESYAGFDAIKIDVDFLDQITLKEGDGYQVRGQNYERFGGMNVQLTNGTLFIDAKREGRWLNFGIDELLDWNIDDCWLEITYPKGTKFDGVNMNVSAGRIIASGFDSGGLDINNSFGKIDVSAVSCETLSVIANSGDVQLADIDVQGGAIIDNDFGGVTLKNINAGNLSACLNAGNADISGIDAGMVTIVNNFGRIDFDDAVSENLSLRLNSGDLSASNIETEALSIESDFGLVRIDGLLFSGIAEINQNSGDVRIGLNMSEDDLSYEIDTDAGNVTIGGRKTGNSTSSRGDAGGASLVVNSDFGNVSLKFLK